MRIEEFIQMHNEALEQKAREEPFLSHRLKARIREIERGEPVHLTPVLRKKLWLYGFAFIILTVIQFMVINGIHKPERVRPFQANIVSINSIETLNPAYPGSIALAYEKTIGVQFHEEEK